MQNNSIDQEYKEVEGIKPVKPLTLIILFLVVIVEAIFLGIDLIRNRAGVSLSNIFQNTTPTPTVISGFPLEKYLPYTTNKYRVTYLRENSLLITPYVKEDKEVLTEEIKQWVNSYGIDPESQKYVFIEALKPD